MDLFVKDIELDNGRIIYHTGVHVALPEDYEMEIRPRSGFTNSELIMQNAPATIDEGYSGEIIIISKDNNILNRKIMNRYVKKPIAIEAVKWKGFNNDEIKDFAGDSVKIEVIREGDADNGIPPSVDCSIM